MMERSRPFLMLGKVTFDERVNVLERSCKGDLSITFTLALFPKSKVLKGQVSRSVGQRCGHGKSTNGDEKVIKKSWTNLLQSILEPCERNKDSCIAKV